MRCSKNFRVFISDKYSEKLIKLRTTQDRAMYTENNYGSPICLLYFSHVPHVALSTVPCLNLNHSSLFYFMSKCKVFKALSNVADVRVPCPQILLLLETSICLLPSRDGRRNTTSKFSPLVLQRHPLVYMHETSRWKF